MLVYRNSSYVRGRCAVAALLSVFGVLSIAAAAPPNILMLIADDMDWRDLGCLGNEVIQTPNLDALAERGLICRNAFLTTPQCSPTRISVLTGKYPHATGAEDLHMPLPDGERIVPSYLKELGYFTGHMRKTHYGPNGNKQFDWYDRGVDKMGAFLDAAGDRPFFMWVGFRDSHRPYREGAFDPPHEPADVKVPPYLADTPETRKDLALYYDEVARLDKNSGAILETVESRGLLDNTLVIFFGDNGRPFPRAKGTLYDSGIGTPFIAAWPGVIPEGETFEGLVSVIDLAPTFLDVAGYERAPAGLGMQGRSMLPVFQDPATASGRDYVFSERNWHNCDEHMRSVRTQRYKLIRNAYLELPHGTAADLGRSPSFKSLLKLKQQGQLTSAQAMLFTVPRPRIELYDLQADPWETRNLAETEEGREIAQELETVLDEWREETGDFSPKFRRRANNTDRFTGEKFMDRVPPMTHLRPGDPVPVERQ